MTAKLMLLNLLIFLTVINGVFAMKKIWKHTSPLLDGTRWLGQNVPKNCSDQTIVFPSKLYGLVNMEGSIATGEMVFPEDGGLILNDGATIMLPDPFDKVEGVEKCEKKEVTFVRPAVKEWFSVDSWEPVYDMGEKKFNKATPDVLRIPCDGDSIIFPNTSTFLVDLKFASQIHFYDIEINGETKMDDLKTFLQSDVGQSIFMNGEQTEISAGTCESRKNCLCRGADALCSNMECPVVHCMEPVNPKGFCCPFCGGVITFPVDDQNSFDLQGLNKKIEQSLQLSNLDVKSIEFYAAFIIENFIQLVFVDKGDYTEQSGQVATYVHKNLIQKLFDNPQIFFKSGMPYVPGQKIRSFNMVLWSFMVVVIFFGAFYVYHYENRAIPRIMAMMRTRQFAPSQFIFARFDNQAQVGDGLVDIDLKSSEEADEEEKPSSFNNPLYEGALGLNETGSSPGNSEASIDQKSEEKSKSPTQETKLDVNLLGPNQN